MTKQTADRLLRRMYAYIKEHDVRARITSEDKKLLGSCNWEWDHIRIDLNPRETGEKGGFLSTLVHECLHMIRPDLDETTILKMEKGMFAKLTDRQLQNLLKRFAWRMAKERGE